MNKSVANRKKNSPLRKAIKFSLSFVLIFWIIQIAGYLFPNLTLLGILPRTTIGLLGIITSPFVHANFQHLIANSLPFFVLTCFLLLFYKDKAILIFVLIWITTGIFTWLIGRSAWHIGASGVIYGMASFLFFGGIMSWNPKLMFASILVLIFYSGLIWGIFPGDQQVSWEGHLSGALSGLIWAYVFRKALQNT